MRDLLELTLPTLRSAGSRWLLCLSGGLDSRVLFDLCLQAAPRLAAELVTVHVDHNLRPGSGADARFCEALARAHHTHHEPISLHIAPRASTQDAARRQRWAAIADVARELEISAVLTAHHADDALETFLINATRGAGSTGLASLGHRQRSVPWAPDLTLVRPLLEARRAELEAHARANNLAWAEDPTNATDHYTRNAIRHTILPELESRFGAAGMIATVENLRRESAFLEERARQALEDARLPSASLTSAALDTQKLTSMNEVIATRVIRAVIKSIDAPTWSRRHIDELLEVISRGETCRLTYPGVVTEITPSRTELHRTRGRGTSELDARMAHPIEFAPPALGEVIEASWFGATLRVSSVHADDPSMKQAQRSCRARFDADALGDRLTLRAIAGSDRLWIGKESHRSAKKLVRDAAVPRFQRWCWPCICDTHDLLWIPGVRRSAHARVSTSTRRILIIERIVRCEIEREGLLK